MPISEDDTTGGSGFGKYAASSVHVESSSPGMFSPAKSSGLECEGISEEELQCEIKAVLSALLARLTFFFTHLDSPSPSATNSWGDPDQSPSATASLNTCTKDRSWP